MGQGAIVSLWDDLAKTVTVLQRTLRSLAPIPGVQSAGSIAFGAARAAFAKDKFVAGLASAYCLELR